MGRYCFKTRTIPLNGSKKNCLSDTSSPGEGREGGGNLEEGRRDRKKWRRKGRGDMMGKKGGKDGKRGKE